MDNFRFDVTSQGRTNFDLVFKLAFGGKFGTKATATHYAKDNENRRFVLFYFKHGGAIELPTPLSLEAASDLVWHWLESGASYGKQPDHDGDNGKGWRVYNEAWGHVQPYGYQAFVAIEPTWAMYGK